MVSTEGDLQIADLSFLPDSAPLAYDINTVGLSHNIFIDSLNGSLYSVNGGVSGSSVYHL